MAVTADKERISMNHLGGENSIIVTYEGRGTYKTPRIVYTQGGGDWITVTMQGEVTQDVVEYQINLDTFSNNYLIFYDRTAYIVFSDDIGEISIPVNQSNGYLHIGGDYLYRDGAEPNSKYEYVLKIGGETIYKGVSVPVTSGGYPESVNVSRLVEDYVYTNMYEDDYYEWTDLGDLAVDFYQISNGDEVYRRTFYYSNNWNQYGTGDWSGHTLNRPITGHFTDYMTLPICVYNDSKTEYKVVYTNKDGRQDTDYWDFPQTPYAVRTIDIWNDKEDVDIIEVFLKKSDLWIPQNRYTRKRGDGVLTYLNEQGGWDVFLIEGNIHKYANYDRDEYTKEQTISPYSFSTGSKKVNRVNTTTTYDCSTGWLSLEAAERLVVHLLSSPTVYFQYTNESNYVFEEFSGEKPVIITNTQAEYKCFKNGRNLVRYNITFEDSDTKTRRG